MSFFKKILSFGLLLFICSSPEIISQRNINAIVKDYSSKIIYCGSAKDKEFTIALEIGRVYAADTLYGYNFELGFNPKKLRFKSKLIQNTLAEFFEFSDATFHSEGYVRGYAANLKNKIVYGDRPLIAFVGTFLSDCDDTAEIKLNYLEFTDEFRGKLDSIKNLTLSMEKNPSATDFTKIVIDSINLKFVSKEDKELNMKLSVNSIKSYQNAMITLITSNFNDNLEITDIQTIDTLAKVNNITKLNDTIKISITSLNDFKSELPVKLKLKSLKNENIKANLSAYFEISENCNCIKYQYAGYSKIEIERKDTVSNIEEIITRDDLYQINNEIYFKDGISKISIYNLNGILISEINTENKKSINLNDLNSGIYFIVYDKENNRNSRKILINKL